MLFLKVVIHSYTSPRLLYPMISLFSDSDSGHQYCHAWAGICRHARNKDCKPQRMVAPCHAPRACWSRSLFVFSSYPGETKHEKRTGASLCSCPLVSLNFRMYDCMTDYLLSWCQQSVGIPQRPSQAAKLGTLKCLTAVLHESLGSWKWSLVPLRGMEHKELLAVQPERIVVEQLDLSFSFVRFIMGSNNFQLFPCLNVSFSAWALDTTGSFEAIMHSAAVGVRHLSEGSEGTRVGSTQSSMMF